MNAGAGDCIISLCFIYTKNCKKWKRCILKDIDYHKKTFIYETIEKIIDPIWKKGFGITFIDGALDENKFELRNKAIRMLLREDPKLKECFVVE